MPFFNQSFNLVNNFGHTLSLSGSKAYQVHHIPMIKGLLHSCKGDINGLTFIRTVTDIGVYRFGNTNYLKPHTTKPYILSNRILVLFKHYLIDPFSNHTDLTPVINILLIDKASVYHFIGVDNVVLRYFSINRIRSCFQSPDNILTP